jgi:hypothetical protein
MQCRDTSLRMPLCSNQIFRTISKSNRAPDAVADHIKHISLHQKLVVIICP